MRISSGRLFGLFSFDVAWEIDLPRFRAEQPAPAGAELVPFHQARGGPGDPFVWRQLVEALQLRRRRRSIHQVQVETAHQPVLVGAGGRREAELREARIAVNEIVPGPGHTEALDRLGGFGGASPTPGQGGRGVG